MFINRREHATKENRTRLFVAIIVLFIVCATICGSVIAKGNSHEEGYEESGFTLKKLLMPGKLIQGHAKNEAECRSCHEKFSNKTQSGLCLDCHEQIAEDFEERSGFHGLKQNLMDSQCVSCHSEHEGRDADIMNIDTDRFEHKWTNFELKGKHLGAECQQCHSADKKYRDTPNRCLSCHQENNPHNGAFSEECQDCHTEETWDKTRFAHNDVGYALKGRHEQTECAACHPANSYNSTPDDCFSCHVLSDVHNGANGELCADCHTENDWNKITFNHDIDTEFKLRAAHKKASCNSCHKDTDFDKAIKSSCVSCHKFNDVHAGKNGSDCQQCHVETQWKKVSFSHTKNTDFKLEGKHADLLCESCHRGEIDDPLESQCISCHKLDDVHKQQQGTKCESCHNPEGWQDEVRFNHELTSFPLLGMHALASCQSCHLTREYIDTKSECIDCHDPDSGHGAALGKECGNCHNPNDWKLWLFDHNLQTDFKLDGEHQNLSCNSCHDKPAKKKVIRAKTCVSCHLGDDKHGGRFGRQCERCHTTNSFSEIRLQ